MSITGSAPFNGAADQTVAVAYVAAFILVFFVSTFDATFPTSPFSPSPLFFPLFSLVS